mmetsp:Transcript_162/g.679  ORF Transcript_162/g.679 Transcript_162/m.679 type:complete len:396 (+) Transcript_162:62-1249(+)
MVYDGMRRSASAFWSSSASVADASGRSDTSHGTEQSGMMTLHAATTRINRSKAFHERPVGIVRAPSGSRAVGAPRLKSRVTRAATAAATSAPTSEAKINVANPTASSLGGAMMAASASMGMYPMRKPNVVRICTNDSAHTAPAPRGGHHTMKSRHNPSAASATAPNMNNTHNGARAMRSAITRSFTNPVGDVPDDGDDDIDVHCVVPSMSPEPTSRPNAAPNAQAAANPPTDAKSDTTPYPQFGNTSSNAQYVYAPNVSNAVGAILYKTTAATLRANVADVNGAYLRFARANIPSLDPANAIEALMPLLCPSSSPHPSWSTPCGADSSIQNHAHAAAHANQPELNPTAVLALTHANTTTPTPAPQIAPNVLVAIAIDCARIACSRRCCAPYRSAT